MTKSKLLIIVSSLCFSLLVLVTAMLLTFLPSSRAANESAILALISTNYSTSAFTITNNSTYPWAVNSTSSKEIKSGNASKSSTTSAMTITYTAAVGDVISFSYMVSSESSYDKLTIKVGSTTVANAISGAGSYKSYSYTVSSAGSISLSFSYSKDGSVNSNSDAGFVKNISIMAATRKITATCNSSHGSVTGSGSYNIGTSVTLKATANSNYTFIGWKKDSGTSYVSTSASYTISVSANATYTAVFGGKITFTTDSGSVSSAGGVYEINATATSTATASAGTQFLHWLRASDGAKITDNPINATVSKNETYTAVFGWEITFSASGGSVTSSGGFYGVGTTASVSAYANADSTFLYWIRSSDGVQIMDNPLNVSVTKADAYTAIFTDKALTGVNVSSTYGGCVTLIGADFELLGDNDLVEFRAVATISGYSFSHWLGMDGTILSYDANAKLKKSLVYNNILTAVFTNS